MPADSLVHLSGLDSRETLIEVALVLSFAMNDDDVPDLLEYSYDSSEAEPVLQLFGLKMPRISDTRLPTEPMQLLAESAKVLQQYDQSDVPLTASLVCLNLLGRCSSDPLVDVIAHALWPKIWEPIRGFLRSQRPDGEGVPKEGEHPGPPIMQLEDPNFSWNPHDELLLGDYTMWARGTGPLFHSLTGWNSAWTMPPRPTGQNHYERVAYWMPLAQLALGPFGWTDPTFGTARWVLRGMPKSEPGLQVMADVWGADALMFFSLTNDWIPSLDDDGTFQSGIGSGERVFARHERAQRLIGGGGFHISTHIGWQMFREESAFPAKPELAGDIFDGNRNRQEKVVILKRFAGWYRNLEILGADLPRGCHLHVIAPPIGYLGRFSQDDETGKWHSISTLLHRSGAGT